MHFKENPNLYTFVTGLIVLTLLLVIYIVSFIRQQKSRMRFFKLQVSRDMELIEEERKRIASDLHDDLGPLLASVHLGLESIQSLIPQATIVKDTINNLNHSLGKVRALSHNLVPGTLGESGLAAAIEELVSELQSPVMKFSFTKLGDDSQFLPAKSLALFRVVKEILTNAVKHSHATKVQIQLTIESKKLLLNIGDNGTGFNTKQNNTTNALGLSNIRSRLSLLNAEHAIESSPGNGTIYKIKIPIASLIKP